jgi:hypothetical protein
MLFLVGGFIDISTIHAEAGSRTGSIQIIYKERNSSDKLVDRLYFFTRAS